MYSNLPIDIKLRSPISRGDDQYNLMILRIFEGANSDNSRVYDSSHHSSETRSSRAYHKTCTIFTPKTYAQTSLEATKLQKKHFGN